MKGRGAKNSAHLPTRKAGCKPLIYSVSNELADGRGLLHLIDLIKKWNDSTLLRNSLRGKDCVRARLSQLVAKVQHAG